MAIRLFDRIAILLKADAHGIVESLEERSLLLKQCVREAELELGRKRARLDALREEEKRLSEILAAGEAAVRSLDEDVRLALAGGREDLARFAIRRLLPRQREVTALVGEINRRSTEIAQLAQRLEAQEAEFDRLRARVREQLTRESESLDVLGRPPETSVADEEVELELMRRQAEKGARS
jgi:phage shock protein A